ncbi:MAG: hypothetical protein AAFW84_26320, partial [Cyanobacteria bacterium J06635_15]
LFAADEVIGASLHLTFFDTSEPQQAKVIFFELEETAYGQDAAVLYLPSALPLGGSPATRHPLRQFNRAALQIFGYPGSDAAGRNLTAVTRGEVDGGWVQVEDTKEPGLAIEPGFSGSPVWQRDESPGTVGMVVARHQGQDTAKVGFILPIQKLQAALNQVKLHSLLVLLRPHQSTLASQITTAYKVCRPDTWSEPFQNELASQLTDIAQMSEGKLVEFAACLWGLPGVEQLQDKLLGWIERYKHNDIELSTLLAQIKQQREEIVSRQAHPFQPCLLISIQADRNTKKEPYQVNAWIVPDTRRYNSATGEGYDPTTGEGAEALADSDWQKYVENPDAIDFTNGIDYKHLPIFLAVYVDQVAKRGLSLQELTIEFFLPMALINQPIEQCLVPDEYGFPMLLGIDEDCAHIVIRSQERLEYARGKNRWETKWNRLQTELNSAAIDAFVDGDALSAKSLQTPLKSALGLKLTQKLPKAAKQGEIGVLLATGTPIAVWLRCQGCELANRLHNDILDDCLEQVPKKVSALRRETPALDEDGDPEAPPELGHHLSFLWEDFYRVPPSITYSDEQLL